MQDFTVDETSTGKQFRFVRQGPELRESEWRACLNIAGSIRVVSTVGAGDSFLGAFVLQLTQGRPLEAAFRPLWPPKVPPS